MRMFKSSCMVLMALLRVAAALTTQRSSSSIHRNLQATPKGSCTASMLSPGDQKMFGSLLCYPMPSSGVEPIYKFGIDSDNNLAYYAYDQLIWKAEALSADESTECIVFGDCVSPPMTFFRLQKQGSLVGYDWSKNKIWVSHENIETNGKYSSGVFVGDGSTDAVGDPISGSKLIMNEEGVFIQSSGEVVTWRLLAPVVDATSSSAVIMPSSSQVSGMEEPTPDDYGTQNTTSTATQNVAVIDENTTSTATQNVATIDENTTSPATQNVTIVDEFVSVSGTVFYDPSEDQTNSALILDNIAVDLYSGCRSPDNPSLIIKTRTNQTGNYVFKFNNSDSNLSSLLAQMNISKFRVTFSGLSEGYIFSSAVNGSDADTDGQTACWDLEVNGTGPIEWNAGVILFLQPDELAAMPTSEPKRVPYIPHGDDEVVIRLTVSDILVLASAGLCMVKSLFAVGVYCYKHVMLAVIELGCTALALAIFVVDEFLGEDGTVPEFGNDNIYIFFLAFVLSCITEIIDVFFTYRTVRAYKSVKEKHRHSPYGLGILAKGKKNAKCTYMVFLALSAIFSSLNPLIAFGKSGWIVEYFTPSEFSSQNSTLLLVYMILIISGQVQLFLVHAGVCTESMEYLKVLLNWSGAIVVWVVLARVTGAEAGSLTYLLMLNVYQDIEMNAESSRMMFWLRADKEGLEEVLMDDDEGSKNESGKDGDGCDFDEQDMELNVGSTWNEDDGLDFREFADENSGTPANTDQPDAERTNTNGSINEPDIELNDTYESDSDDSSSVSSDSSCSSTVVDDSDSDEEVLYATEVNMGPPPDDIMYASESGHIYTGVDL